ncbi:MAG: hypothetical protein SFY70_10120 [Bacteroidia bacterium]|nr:hypothetical protein [Bacteroidia bacterium]
MFTHFWARSPLLTQAGLGLLVIGLLLIPVAFLDSRVITGQSAWIKPIKFAFSGGIFLLTVAWLLGDFTLPVRYRRLLEWSFLLVMWVEVVLIAIQASRGIPSHYNITTPLNAAIFGTMGAAIFFNTFLVALVAVAYLVPLWGGGSLPVAYRWAVAGALLLVIFSGWVGTQMVAHRGHTIGAPDDGPGLPLLGWSTTGGDLRWAHFLGLHGLQLVLLSWHLLRALPTARVGVTVGLLVVVSGLTVASYVQALQGKPVVAQKRSIHSTHSRLNSAP